MIRSMTAYANGEASTETAVLSCEMRSVNHRYLELSLRLPEELRSMEAALRERISQQIARGKLEVSFRIQTTLANTQLQLNEQALVEMAALAHACQNRLPGMTVSFTDLIRMPGMLHEQTANSEVLKTLAVGLLEATLARFVEARAREGQKLAQVIHERLNAIEQIVMQTRQWLPEIRTALRAKLDNKLAELKQPLEPGRLEQEVVLAIQKMDVDEELDRLTSHLSEARRILGLPEAVGRRLDFMLQEFNRESNTLGSKSVDLRTSQASVELKVLIEQIREQVQNLE